MLLSDKIVSLTHEVVSLLFNSHPHAILPDLLIIVGSCSILVSNFFIQPCYALLRVPAFCFQKFFFFKKIDFMVPLSVYFIITAFVNLIASFTVLTEEMSLLLKDIICHVFDYVYLLL